MNPRFFKSIFSSVVFRVDDSGSWARVIGGMAGWHPSQITLAAASNLSTEITEKEANK